MPYILFFLFLRSRGGAEAWGVDLWHGHGLWLWIQFSFSRHLPTMYNYTTCNITKLFDRFYIISCRPLPPSLSSVNRALRPLGHADRVRLHLPVSTCIVHDCSSTRTNYERFRHHCSARGSNHLVHLRLGLRYRTNVSRSSIWALRTSYRFAVSKHFLFSI